MLYYVLSVGTYLYLEIGFLADFVVFGLIFPLKYGKKTAFFPMRFLYRFQQVILLCGDVVAFGVGLYLGLFLRYRSAPDFEVINAHIGLFSIIFLLWLAINYMSGLYDLTTNRASGILIRRLAESGGIALIASIILVYLLPHQSLAPKTILVLTLLIGYCLSALWHTIFAHWMKGQVLHHRVLFVGNNQEVSELIAHMARLPEKGYLVVGVIDPKNGVVPPGVNVSTNVADIENWIKQYNVNLIAMAPHMHADSGAVQALYRMLFSQTPIIDVTSLYEIITGRIPPSTFSESWFLEHLRKNDQPLYEHIRMVIDYVAALVMGIVCIVLVPIVMLLIRLSSPGPIFIRQQRMGKDNKTFTLYKFRSMYALSPDGSAEVNGVQFAIKDDKRVTPIGRWLRKMHLDELPQIWNLIKRDVSLIGPRPERPEIARELESRLPYYPLRHVVRPGLTGWALIHQNYTDNYDTSLEKLQYDLYYIKHRSLLLDLGILLRTVNVIIRFQGQ